MSIYVLRSDNLEKILFNDNFGTLAQTIIRLCANLANQSNSTAPSCDDAIGAVASASLMAWTILSRRPSNVRWS